jgi:hypothetical protein
LLAKFYGNEVNEVVEDGGWMIVLGNWVYNWRGRRYYFNEFFNLIMSYFSITNI